MTNSEQMVTGWQELSQVLSDELAVWRASHPRATLAQLQGQVQQTVSRLHERYLTDLVHASPLADLAQAPPEARPTCPTCGEPLYADGQQERQILVPGQAPPLRLQRSYAVCPACEAGLFPPG